jgi:hypothetical protein
MRSPLQLQQYVLGVWGRIIVEDPDRVVVGEGIAGAEELEGR